MKIAILTAAFVPRVLAGTEIATYYIAKHLNKRGYDVHIITSLDKGLPKESVDEGLCIHRGRVIKKPFFGMITYFIHAIRTIIKLNPDIIHVKSIQLSIIALIAKKVFRKPYIVWAQGSDVYLPSRFYRFLYKYILSAAEVIIAQTNDERLVIQKICNTIIHMIPNGVDLERFGNFNKLEVRHKLKLNKNEKLILYVGSLRPVKGVKYLIQAMQIVCKKNNEVRLILLGTGSERQVLETMTLNLGLTNRIDFRGEVSNDQVLEYMSAADIFVLPSLSEGFPLVLVEAMASGLPIVTTNVRGLTEIIHENRNGFTVEAQNPLEIAIKVLLLLENDKLREDISKTNICDSRSYTWEDVVDKLEQVYNTAVITN